MSKQSTAGSSIFRRHPFLIAIGLLSALCLTAAGILLATFDLNAYRESLADRLSTALNQPVRIGSADMSWRQGPVFDLTDIRIGVPQEEPVGEIAHLLLHPRLLPLLLGKVVFNKMILEQPRYRLRLSPPASGSDDLLSAAPLTALLQTVQVHKLRIVDGQLFLEDSRTNNPTASQLCISGIQLSISNLLTGRPGKLQLRAELQQPEGIAILDVKGRTTFGPELGNWRQVNNNLQLQLSNIDAEQLLAWFSLPEGIPALSGHATISVSTEGVAAKGLHFAASLSGDNLSLLWTNHYATPPSLKTVKLTGNWIASEHLNRFEDLNLHLDDLNLTGHLSLQRNQQQPWLEGTLASTPLALSTIRRFLPDHIRLSEQALWQRSLGSGMVQIDHLRFAGPLRHFRQAGARLPITDARVTLNDARLQLSTFPTVEKVNFSLTLAEGKLHMNQGSALLLEKPIHFSGTAEHPLQDDMSLSFSANWEAPANKLQETFFKSETKDSRIGGVIPVAVSLNGRPGQLRGKMQAALAGCTMDIPGILSKETGSPGELHLSLSQEQQHLNIDQGFVSLSPFDLTVSGQLGLEGNHHLDLRLTLAETDLTEAGNLVPILAAHDTSGSLALTGQLSGSLSQPDFSGQAVLTGAGLRLRGIKAPLRDINGTVAIHNKDCAFSDLKAVLGHSPATLNGTLVTHPEPVFDLQVNAPRMGAAELIFPGSSVVFHNLNGRIAFDRKKILYQQIHFDLEESRNLTLEGIQPHAVPGSAELDIHAEKASIDEVLALWKHDSSPTPQQHHGNTHLVIRAAVDHGHYGPLSFNNARGIITVQNHMVNITPLTFTAGSGTCQAEILIDNTHAGHSELTLSAQLKDLDAEHLHTELQQQQGLVTGKLSGHFKLQGPAGPDLLILGKGQAEVHIKDGMLRKFSFLSKVFSLLNVSQIFSLHLPDMAKHGMPFTSLDATVKLADGRLETEDLAVTGNAINLSLVGNYDLRQDQFDLVMGVKPFGTVDKIVSKIPLAGWILTGESKALITAHFRICGPSKAPEVEAIPITSVSEKAIGIFQRVLGLPGKVVNDVGQLFKTKEDAKDKPAEPAADGDQSPQKEQDPQ